MSRILAAGALVVTASLGTVVAGLAGAVGPLASPAAASALEPFDDCVELREWYVEQALPLVGPYGLEAPGWAHPVAEDAAEGAGPVGSGRATAAVGADAGPDTAVSGSATGTNVQEAGVDEPDRAKTDGRLVVHVRGRTLVVTDASGSSPRRLGTLRLPDDVGAAELLLAGDTALVLGTPAGDTWWTDAWTGPRLTMPAGPPAEATRLLEVSLADPSAPAVVSDRTLGGALVSARQYGDGGAGTVRLVVRTSGPALDFVQPHRSRTPEEATEENRRILRESTIEDWLPSLREQTGAPEPLVRCADVLHPEAGSALGALTVLTLPGGDPEAAESLAVTVAGEAVYSSADRLYVAAMKDERSTDVHAFALTGSDTAYAASGTVRGTLRDRWSMDERDGVLRLAVAFGRVWLPDDNGVVTLREDGDRLREVGRVRGLGPDEQIMSVRWFDDLAILVTFRQTDPVYTVDLSDPDRPRKLGELKIPGFSEYLHPIGGDRLLGLGVNASAEGVVLAGQASVFDVADLSRPERIGVAGLGRERRPAAGLDPRALTWLGTAPGRGTALTAVSTSTSLWGGGSPRLVELVVRADGSVVTGRQWPMRGVPADDVRALPLAGGRVAVVGAGVTMVQGP